MRWSDDTITAVSRRTAERVYEPDGMYGRLAAAEAEVKRWLAFIERGMDTHMQFSTLKPDGTIEQLPCADWCYACRLDRTEAERDDAQAAITRVQQLADRWDLDGPPPGNRPLTDLRAVLPETEPTKDCPMAQYIDHTGIAQKLLDQQSDINRLTEERDGAYRERARLVALIAGGLAEQAVIAPAPDIDEPGWQILYITLHGRQCSWHIAPRDAELFACIEHVPADDSRAKWDKHTTEEKYAHIDYLAHALGCDPSRCTERAH